MPTDPSVEFVSVAYLPISEDAPIEKTLIVYVPRPGKWIEATKYSKDGAWFANGFERVYPTHYCELPAPKGEK